VFKFDQGSNMTFQSGQGWALVWGGPQAESATGIVVDSSSVYVCGSSNSLGSLSVGSFDIFLLKIDALRGVLEWALRMGGAGSDIANGIAVLGGTVYMVGQSATWSSGKTDMVFISVNPAAEPVAVNWAASLGGAGDDIAVAIAGNSADNSLYALGYGDTPALSSGSFDVYVIRYATDGTLTYLVTLGGSNTD